MMASANNFLSNINSGQCPLSLLTFDDKLPVFLSSTKEKRRRTKRWSKTENNNSNSCYENETRLGTTISKAKTNPSNLLLPNKELVFARVESESERNRLGADHLTLEGGVWMISKKSFLQALDGRKKLHAAQMKLKKFLHCCKQEKKMLQSWFHHSRGTLQNPSKTATILPLLPLNSGVGYASECAMQS